jgi:hypothetical protein
MRSGGRGEGMRWSVLLVVLAGLVLPPVAQAGVYDVYGCRLSDGTRTQSVDGWTPWSVYGTREVNVCAGSGGLFAAFDSTQAHAAGELAGWVFDAPRDTSINNYTLYRSSVVETMASGAEFQTWHYHDAPVDIFDPQPPSRYVQEACVTLAHCFGLGDDSTPLAPVNRFEQAGLNVRRVIYAVRCSAGTACEPGGTRAHVNLWATRIGLSDLFAPTFSRVPAGSLVDATGPIDGERSVSFRARSRIGDCVCRICRRWAST